MQPKRRHANHTNKHSSQDANVDPNMIRQHLFCDANERGGRERETQRERGRERKRGRERQRQTHTERERERDKERQKDTEKDANVDSDTKPGHCKMKILIQPLDT